MIFKMYNCDFGMKYLGVDYVFSDVDSFVIEDPERTRLTRGSNAANKEGLIYKEGAKEPKVVTVTIMNLTQSLKLLLDTIYKNKARVDAVYSIDRTDGSSKLCRNAILSTQPQQLSLDETSESMNVSLVFESFDLSEDHKS